MAKFRDGVFRVLTANDVLTGEVVFLSDRGTWSGDLNQARLARTQKEVAVLDVVAASAEIEAVTVAPYTIDVERGANGGLRPLRTRETIRISGPLVPPPAKPGNTKPAPQAARRPRLGMLTPAAGNGDDHVSI